jgi:HAD superfamily hydrolase (TIGR01450 family)
LSELDGPLAERVAGARAVVFDMDGTLILGNALSEGFHALPGAADVLAILKRRGIPFRVFTNGTAKTPEVYAASLRQVGLDVDDAEMMTPSSAAAVWFTRRRIRRIRVLGLEGVQSPLRRAGLEVIAPGEKAAGVEAVFTGQFREFTFPDLEAACRDVWGGAVLTTASNVPFFATHGGRGIGVSFAVNAMLRAMTGKRAQVLGKPSRSALVSALRLMGLPQSALERTVVVGDDPVLEMGMARSAGAVGIAVTTGLNDGDTFSRAGAALRPHAVLQGLVPLVALFESMKSTG